MFPIYQRESKLNKIIYLFLCQEFETFTASLGDGEHFQKLEINSSWFIEKVKLTSNLGNVSGPYGGGGGEDRRPHRTIRKGVKEKHVYLDGVRGHVVSAQGAKALNRVSFKWCFVMDKKISKYSYHHSVVLRPDNERISVLDLVSCSHLCIVIMMTSHCSPGERYQPLGE